jgi:hypothetical protein
VGLERGSLTLVSTIEELLGRKSSGSGLESLEYGRGDPFWPRDALYPQTLAPTSPINGGRSVGIVRFRTQATEFSSFLLFPFPFSSCDRGLRWKNRTLLLSRKLILPEY